jgi:hypothetical protein
MKTRKFGLLSALKKIVDEETITLRKVWFSKSWGKVRGKSLFL